jgi:hypothetical protein
MNGKKLGSSQTEADERFLALRAGLIQAPVVCAAELPHEFRASNFSILASTCRT